MSEVIYVATYGSLRRGQANYLVNDRAGAKSIGEGWTEDNFDLFRYGGSSFVRFRNRILTCNSCI